MAAILLADKPERKRGEPSAVTKCLKVTAPGS